MTRVALPLTGLGIKQVHRDPRLPQRGIRSGGGGSSDGRRDVYYGLTKREEKQRFPRIRLLIFGRLGMGREE